MFVNVKISDKPPFVWLPVDRGLNTISGYIKYVLVNITVLIRVKIGLASVLKINLQGIEVDNLPERLIMNLSKDLALRI